MRQSPFKTGLIFASWAMLLIFGCHKTKPPVPQEAPPPAIQQQPTQAQPQPTPSPTPTPEQQATNTKPEEKPTPAYHPRTRPAKKTPANGEKPAASGTEKPSSGTGEKPTTEAKNIPPKVIIQDGGTNSTTSQVSSGQKENNGNQPTTEQLLKDAEDNLRNLKRELSDSEKSTKNHILDYIAQSRKATEESDPVRAHTLALKARLLSDDLVKSK